MSIQTGDKHGIEQVIARIDEHLTGLDKATCDLHAQTSRAERDGCTRDEIDAIEDIYVRAPLQMLLITTKTIINAIPDDSGFDLDRIVRIIEQHAKGGTTSYEMAEDLVELLRECIAHIRAETSGASRERPDVPRIH